MHGGCMKKLWLRSTGMFFHLCIYNGIQHEPASWGNDSLGRGTLNFQQISRIRSRILIIHDLVNMMPLGCSPDCFVKSDCKLFSRDIYLLPWYWSFTLTAYIPIHKNMSNYVSYGYNSSQTKHIQKFHCCPKFHIIMSGTIIELCPQFLEKLKGSFMHEV